MDCDDEESSPFSGAFLVKNERESNSTLSPEVLLPRVFFRQLKLRGEGDRSLPPRISCGGGVVVVEDGMSVCNSSPPGGDEDVFCNATLGTSVFPETSILGDFEVGETPGEDEE